MYIEDPSYLPIDEELEKLPIVKAIKRKATARDGFIKNFNNICSKEMKLLENQIYNGGHGKLEFLHYKCRETFFMSPMNLIDIGNQKIKSSCKKCCIAERDLNQRYTLEQFLESLKQK